MKLDTNQNRFLLLDIHSLTMNWEIADFKNYIEAQIVLHQRLVSELEDKYLQLAESNIGHIDEQNDPFEEDRMRYKDSFPAIMRKSIFLSIYSFLETELKIFVRFMYDPSDQSEPFTKKHSPGVKDYIGWLKENSGLNFSKLNDSISKIHDYTKIRNNLIHHNGDFFHEEKRENKKNNKAVRSFRETIVKYPGLEIDVMYVKFKIVNDHFLSDFLDLVENFLNTIINEGKALRNS